MKAHAEIKAAQRVDNERRRALGLPSRQQEQRAELVQKLIESKEPLQSTKIDIPKVKDPFVTLTHVPEDAYDTPEKYFEIRQAVVDKTGVEWNPLNFEHSYIQGLLGVREQLVADNDWSEWERDTPIENLVAQETFTATLGTDSLSVFVGQRVSFYLKSISDLEQFWPYVREGKFHVEYRASHSVDPQKAVYIKKEFMSPGAKNRDDHSFRWYANHSKLVHPAFGTPLTNLDEVKPHQLGLRVQKKEVSDYAISRQRFVPGWLHGGADPTAGLKDRFAVVNYLLNILFGNVHSFVAKSNGWYFHNETEFMNFCSNTGRGDSNKTSAVNSTSSEVQIPHIEKALHEISNTKLSLQALSKIDDLPQPLSPDLNSYVFVVNVGLNWVIYYNQPKFDSSAELSGEKFECGWYVVGTEELSKANPAGPHSWSSVREQLQQYATQSGKGTSVHFVVRKPGPAEAGAEPHIQDRFERPIPPAGKQFRDGNFDVNFQYLLNRRFAKEDLVAPFGQDAVLRALPSLHILVDRFEKLKYALLGATRAKHIVGALKEIHSLIPLVGGSSGLQNSSSPSSLVQLRPSDPNQDFLDAYESAADTLRNKLRSLHNDPDPDAVARVKELASEIDGKIHKGYFSDQPEIQTLQTAVDQGLSAPTLSQPEAQPGNDGPRGSGPDDEPKSSGGTAVWVWVLVGVGIVCFIALVYFWWRISYRKIDQAHDALQKSERAALKCEQAAKESEAAVRKSKRTIIFSDEYDTSASSDNGEPTFASRESRGVPAGKSLWPNVDGSRPPPPPPAEPWKLDIRGLGLKPSRVKGTAMPVVPHDHPPASACTAPQGGPSAGAALQQPVPSPPPAAPAAQPDPEGAAQVPTNTDPEKPDPTAPFSQPTPQPGTAVRPAPGTGTEWVERDDLPSPVNIHGGIDSGVTVMGVLVQSAYFDHPPQQVLTEHAAATGTAPPPPPPPTTDTTPAPVPAPKASRLGAPRSNPRPVRRSQH